MKSSLVSLSVLAVLASTPGWSAEASASAVDKLVSCSGLPDTRERLACFDREIAPLAKARSTTAVAPPAAAPLAGVAVAAPQVASAPPAPVPAPPAASRSTAAPAAAPTSAFGDEQLSSKRFEPLPEEKQSMHARITSLREITSTTFLVYLDNGQAWRHEDSTQGAYLRAGDAITVSKAAMGSYRMTRDSGSTKNWIRVTRVR